MAEEWICDAQVRDRARARNELRLKAVLDEFQVPQNHGHAASREHGLVCTCMRLVPSAE